MLMNTLVDGFLLNCRARKLSPATIQRAYAPVLRDVSDWLGNPEVASVTTQDLRNFIVYLGESKRFGRGAHPWMKEGDEPLSSWTIHRYVRVIKRLFNWAHAEGIIPLKNPAASLGFPRLPKGRVAVFSPDEIAVLLSKARRPIFCQAPKLIPGAGDFEKKQHDSTGASRSVFRSP